MGSGCFTKNSFDHEQSGIDDRVPVRFSIDSLHQADQHLTRAALNEVCHGECIL